MTLQKLIHQTLSSLLFASLIFQTGCAVLQRDISTPTSFAINGDEQERGQVTQGELQDDLLRFESQFNARIQSANQALENSQDPKIRYRATLNRLVYGSNSLHIALGPSPESNLLDMVTFIELSFMVLDEYWIPQVFGEAGQELYDAFSESRSQIWTIADKVLDTNQQSQLRKLISSWRNKFPEQINVETVRLSAFSTEASAKAVGLDDTVSGLFASVKQSTIAVDEAKLFAERALYYAERFPFLLRLHARVGAYEIIDDAGLKLAQLPDTLEAQEPMLTDLMTEFRKTLQVTRATLGDADATVDSLSNMMGQLSDNPEASSSATSAISGLTTLLREWNNLLSSEPYQEGVSRAAVLANQVSEQTNRLIKNLAILGVGLIAFFWIMYVIAKLGYRYFLHKMAPSASSEDTDEPRDEPKDRAA